ncbi:hypothetical protein MKW98_012713 [Papaver atlanticum]|uniref:Uncharacterized protein n=1 Tax=Papaver atlanticum TaxID=357466 RepID=A0AAD4SW42_9MAGN|nr:hypothetical protein MKW98_012713 [Papaver atlanticum]
MQKIRICVVKEWSVTIRSVPGFTAFTMKCYSWISLISYSIFSAGLLPNYRQFKFMGINISTWIRAYTGTRSPVVINAVVNLNS